MNSNQQHPKMKQVQAFFCKTLFLLVNLLFLYKYGARQEFIPLTVLLLGYSVVAVLFLQRNVFKMSFSQTLDLKRYYLVFCVSIAVVLFAVVFVTDGNSLNVDRWSAMDVAIRALIHGDYPYTAVDHMEGRTSNFPGLLLIGLPFYAMGNVGYLAIFTFILLVYTLYKNLRIENAFHYMLLLLISPAYWWEVFVISDLMNNMILVLCFVLLIRNRAMPIFDKPVLLGWTTAFLVLTRGIVAIPLVLLVFKDFCLTTAKNKMRYVMSFSLTFVVLCLLTIWNCPDVETLKHYNPLALQTHYLPKYIHIISIVLPFIFSFAIKNFQRDYFISASLLIGFPTLAAFVFNVLSFNFNEMIYDNLFDISYVSIVIPFLLIEIVKQKNQLSDRLA